MKNFRNCSLAGRQTGRQASKQVGRQAGRQSGNIDILTNNDKQTPSLVTRLTVIVIIVAP